MASPCRGVQRPLTPPSVPPAPLLPTFTSLCMMPRSWRYTEEEMEPSEQRVPSWHGTRCHPLGPQQPGAHPWGWLTLPAGPHPWGQWWPSPAWWATHPAPAPARRQTGGRWPQRSGRQHATAHAGPRCCSRCTLPGRETHLTHGAGLAQGTGWHGWHRVAQGGMGTGGSLGSCTEVTWAPQPCSKVMQALGRRAAR